MSEKIFHYEQKQGDVITLSCWVDGVHRQVLTFQMGYPDTCAALQQNQELQERLRLIERAIAYRLGEHPREPSPEMIDAGVNALARAERDSYREKVIAVYEAMTDVAR